MDRRQDMTMRSTIVPEPGLGLDEVGIPRHAALELFKPFVVKKLRDLGHAPTAIDAQKLFAQKTP
jgi:DNA-directed RNA polymerase subunit beta'